MGTVFRAEHVRLKRPVAVKVMALHLARDENALARFSREAEIISQLHHPHVVQVLDFNTTTEGRPYLVMEMLEGRPLDDVLYHFGRLGIGAALQVAIQVASALSAAHQVGVVHRDLKPANIFLVDTGDQLFVKLLDFGISKKTEEFTRAGGRKLTGEFDILGTPEYMAPEQALGRTAAVDARGDQYALAIILYEMLTGQVPFTAEEVMQILRKVIQEPPQPASALREGVTPWLDQTLLRALAKDPAHRFADIVEFSTALEKAAAEFEQRSAAHEQEQKPGQPRRATPHRLEASQLSEVPAHLEAPPGPKKGSHASLPPPWDEGQEVETPASSIASERSAAQASLDGAGGRADTAWDEDSAAIRTALLPEEDHAEVDRNGENSAAIHTALLPEEDSAAIHTAPLPEDGPWEEDSAAIHTALLPDEDFGEGDSAAVHTALLPEADSVQARFTDAPAPAEAVTVHQLPHLPGGASSLSLIPEQGNVDLLTSLVPEAPQVPPARLPEGVDKGLITPIPIEPSRLNTRPSRTSWHVKDPLQSVKSLVERARQEIGLDNLNLAVNCAEEALEVAGSMNDAAINSVISKNARLFRRIFEQRLGSLSTTLQVSEGAKTAAGLSPQQAYMLSRLEGGLSIEEALDLSPLSHENTLAQLVSLMRLGHISIDT